MEAAVWLLERHGGWLQDPRLRPYVDGGVEDDGTVWAGLPFRRVGDAIEAGAFGEEWDEDIAVLRIILSLWGSYPISLRYTCEYLSEGSLSLVAKAGDRDGVRGGSFGWHGRERTGGPAPVVLPQGSELWFRRGGGKIRHPADCVCRRRWTSAIPRCGR
ncbi:hypothetical protein ACFVT6_25735 [Streptomyces sp. NPDC058049]|uniref:hypothetical protein n=1 Tax=Streptomyces sp. NPDC058049 TaxID=3346314 RepID=UPI0036E75A68